MTRQQNEDGMSVTRRNADYYIPGGDLHFLVGDQRFRVHRYFFERESPKFQHELALPASPGLAARGTTELSAIPLDEVDPEEFASFLWVFYNPRYIWTATLEEWTTILRLANEWQFNEIKALALRELKSLPIDLISRIALYEQYGASAEDRLPLYAELCERPEPPLFGEFKRLSEQTQYLIWNARERVRAPPSPGGLSPLPTGVEGPFVRQTLEHLLGLGPSPLTGADDNPDNTNNTTQAEDKDKEKGKGKDKKRAQNRNVSGPPQQVKAGR